MKRGAGADIFLKTLEKVRAAVPGIALRTSFIVGFPGESLRDFEVLEEFIGEAKFDWLGVFSYSHEEGSAAYALDAQVPHRTIESRRKRLMKLQQSISRRAKQDWVGRELTLLAEGASAETPLLWEGRDGVPRARRSTAKSSSTTSARSTISRRAASTAPRSPNPTTTT